VLFEEEERREKANQVSFFSLGFVLSSLSLSLKKKS
jgi:hypothetical protein